MKDLSKKEARWVLPAVVDNEATDKEREAFFAFIKSDPETEKEYNDALFIKRALSSADIQKKMPDQFRKSVMESIERLKKESELDNQDVNSRITLIQTAPLATKWFRYLSVAAAVLLISLITLQLLDLSTETAPDYNDDLVVENIAVEHFINSGGKLIEPHFSTHLPHEAEAYLRDHFGLQITIPTLTDAEFAGIVMADFVDNFKTPLLEYSQHMIGETIYLFAFDMDQVEQHKTLVRHGAAADASKKSEDFYVSEINEHHVVSWLWENTWYAAISNHNGYDLASLVEPLNYSR